MGNVSIHPISRILFLFFFFSYPVHRYIELYWNSLFPISHERVIHQVAGSTTTTLRTLRNAALIAKKQIPFFKSTLYRDST